MLPGVWLRTEIIGGHFKIGFRAREKRDISFRLPVVRSTLRVRVERERVALRVVRKRHACAADALLELCYHKYQGT